MKINDGFKMGERFISRNKNNFDGEGHIFKKSIHSIIKAEFKFKFKLSW